MESARDMMPIDPQPVSGDVRAKEPDETLIGKQKKQPVPIEAKKNIIKKFFKNFRIPKSVIGACMIAAGIYFDKQILIDTGLALLGVGVSSKIIKTSQGGDPWKHEKQFAVLTELFKKGKYDG